MIDFIKGLFFKRKCENCLYLDNTGPKDSYHNCSKISFTHCGNLCWLHKFNKKKPRLVSRLSFIMIVCDYNQLKNKKQMLG